MQVFLRNIFYVKRKDQIALLAILLISGEISGLCWLSGT